MDSHFRTELDLLKQRLLTMAYHAEMAVSRAMQALLKRNDALALQVKEADNVIDQFEVEIDELAIQYLTKAPLAADLRLITIATKIAHNLERIGDEATQIAKRAAALCEEPPVQVHLDISTMAGLSLEMLRNALDAFGHRDTALARTVLPRDKRVDIFNTQIHRELSQFMAEHPETINRCLHWMVVSKSLERIADHATNIAEETVYLYTAQDIRHTNAKNVAPEVLAH